MTMESRRRFVWCTLLASFPFITCDFTRFNIIQSEGNLSEWMKFDLNSTTVHLVFFDAPFSHNPYTVTVVSEEATITEPVFVVVREENAMSTWQIPYVVNNSSTTFTNTSKTLCNYNIFNATTNAASQQFTVSIASSSTKTVSASLKVKPENNFSIKDQKWTVEVSPGSSRYFYYKFQEDEVRVTLEVNSNSTTCLTLSLQEASCPIFDTEQDVTYAGQYESMNEKGGKSIRRADFPNGVVIVFVANADNSKCSEKNSLLALDSRDSTFLTFGIVKGSNDYVLPCLAVTGICAGFVIFAFFLDYISTRYCTNGTNFSSTSVDVEEPSEQNQVPPNNSPSEGTNFSSTSVEVEEPSEQNQVPPNNSASEKTEDDRQPLVEEQDEIEALLNLEKPTIADLAKKFPKEKTEGCDYLWHILSIAVFYGIPVVQLAVVYRILVHKTGEDDICYYNFLCANPAWILGDFNHVFSNIGYILLGILFMATVYFRYRHVKPSSTGVVQHNGTFYAMGSSMIIQGILSGCYHVCPSQTNFQFDTSFMYVMVVLCMISLYQNRHPDVSPTSYAAFTLLGIVIFVSVCGILEHQFWFWMIFALLYFCLCIFVSLKIYFFSFVVKGLKKLKNAIVQDGLKWSTFKPIRKCRFRLLLIANVINCLTLIVGLCLYNRQMTDFRTFLLIILMINSLLYTAFYIVQKCAHKEGMFWKAFPYLILALLSWAPALYCFLKHSNQFTVPPAQSRQLNMECIVWNFFDTHDIWHFLSALALYFTFMFLLRIDENVLKKERRELVAF